MEAQGFRILGLESRGRPQILVSDLVTSKSFIVDMSHSGIDKRTRGDFANRQNIGCIQSFGLGLPASTEALASRMV